jgi:tRNA A37 threonylcarbamoyladenosine biosynthesis protein TsaE
LSGKEEAIEAGFGEILGKSGISIVEWWERAKGIYPQDSILVKFQVEEENSRNLEIFWIENLIF